MSPACPDRRSRSAGNAGFTLPELLVVLVLASVVAAVAAKVVRGQRRSLAAAVELVEMRSQLRQAIHLLATELRPLAPDAGDIHEWSATALRFRSFFGGSAACRLTSDSTLVVPSPSGSEEIRLSSWLMQPQSGDSLLIYDPGRRFGAGDDRWRAFEISAVTPASAAEQCDPGVAALAGVNAGSALRIRVSIGAPLPRPDALGAPVRFFRPVRYALYRSSDRRWYLGASDCNSRRTPACTTIQPVSGPYGSTGSGDGHGITMEYHDRQGRQLDPASDGASAIASIVLVVRGETPGIVGGGARGVRDSLFLVVAPRGARAGEPPGPQ
ncbi:MAG TPA: prepilin-type N-terminal cleavage/methylation domain-containing protein [Gemmatimonadaceae bacterium]|nr:prepilin-type N-terminal cleavage/methylation domain-containing protein [Gemmatimonadaceae bacterium]